VHSPIKFIILITLLILTAWIYFNTVITRKWRNKAPEEYNSWKLGVFYYNPLDKRIFIPKRTGLGFTLNFAHPVSVIIALLLILIISGALL